MNAQLIHTLARERTAELQHAGEQSRLAREGRTRGRGSRHRSLITRPASGATRRQRWFGLDPQEGRQ
jgi:hypothetical protein